MVKFAEAEKRGRGGEGGDRRYTLAVMVERAKMSRAMWESLKAHIIRDRKRKKEEQEADAEEERLRKERENRKKQHAMTLEETREKLSQMEEGLSDLKNQKHQLFQELKVVLNEDATRKRAQQQQNYLKESEMLAHYPHGPIPLGGHPQMLFQSNLVAGRPSLPLHSYKVPPQQPQALIPSGSLKRTRTPSPPPQPGYQQIPYNFKNLTSHAAATVPVTVPTTSKTQKVSSGGGVYVTGSGGGGGGTGGGTAGGGGYYHGSSQNAHSSNPQYQGGAQAVAYLPPPPTASQQAPPPPTQQQPPPTREDKHMGPVYMQSARAWRGPHHMQPTSHYPTKGSHVSTLHPGLEQHKKGGFLPGGASDGAAPDKYFQPGVRSHLALHPGVLPVQQPHPGGGKGGSITSGFPVRSAPPPSSQAPPSAPHPPASVASHVSKPPDAKSRSYSAQPTNYPRSYY